MLIYVNKTCSDCLEILQYCIMQKVPGLEVIWIDDSSEDVPPTVTTVPCLVDGPITSAGKLAVYDHLSMY